ncbi:basic helix-loop-helix domain-containing protein USF3 [Rhinatrema bivittatum]|uniref:basic helix-loop-helix domain-containing protein USF3 n=1 Tax=Rhinatrema bivittatum TaxID=194408 RepID=UPI00112CDEA0|nr:basic helix-loop-helix domain-containing protein USF3 [Rhinatrema bivittatum]
MPEMTKIETANKKQHRKKNRETHNAVERHRKKKINSGINRIGELIPCSPALKQSKNMILDQAWKYITELKRQNDELLLNGGDKEQADEIKRLRKQLYEIQKENGRYIELLKANDICLYDDPTIHWRGNLKNAKVPVVIPTEKVQKNIIVYSNGSQLGMNGQSASVQSITFNVGHNLQKQTANVVPVQRTCNLVTPVTLSAVYTAENKTLDQTSISVSNASQEGPLCLPLTIPAQSILEVSTQESKQSLLASASTGSQDGFQTGMASRQQHPSSNPQQHVSDSNSRLQSIKLPKAAVLHNANLPSAVSILTSQEPHANLPCLDLQESGKDFQESFVRSATDALIQPVEVAIVNSFSPVSADTSTDLNNPRVLATSTAAVQTLSTLSTLSSSCLDTWSFSTSLTASCGSSDLKNVRSLKPIPSTGNTQTTWTTLQLAGNTVQPLNHAPSNIIPTLLNEPVNGTASTSTHNRQATNSVGLNNSLLGGGQPTEQVTGTFISCQSIPMQPLIAQPQHQTQSRGNIIPMNSAMQVIHMTQPVGSAIAPTPANQNVIILQPPNAPPCPPVIRTEVPHQAVGQQIVIIQAANPNPLSLLSAQAPTSVRMPLHAVSPVACPNSSVQNASVPQTFGGKHLVHILPRPSSSSASSSTQSLSVSMPNQQQQPPTISLNGQLFALQPVMSSSGASNQTPMQIIQPTTSEDPNTNVALNTFGALASLSQSISQMAGQNCLQVALHNPTNPSTTAPGPTASTNCISVSTTATPSITTESLTGLHSLSDTVNSSLVKPPAGSPSFAKLKKANKKSNAKKRSTTSKEAVSASKAADEVKLVSTKVEVSKSHSNVEGQMLLENASLIPETSVVCQTNMVSQTGENNSDSPFKEILNSENVGLSSTGEEFNKTDVPCSSVPKSAMAKQFESVTSGPKVSTSLLPTCSAQNELLQSPVSSECCKSCVTSIITISSTEPSMSGIQISGASAPQSSTQTACIADSVSTSQSCAITQESSTEMETTADLLEGPGLSRMLSDIAKEKTSAQKSITLTLEGNPFSTKSIETGVNLPEKQEIILMNTEGENITPQHSCISDQEVSGSSLLGSRQADSPMSTSSGSSRTFSVASMLPDAGREDVANASSHTFSGCTFSEHTDIVGIAARAIFAQENIDRGHVGMQVDISDAASRTAEVLSLTAEHHQHFKAQSCKDSSVLQIEATANKFNSLDLAQTVHTSRPIEKPDCSVGTETSNVSLQISTSANVTSLSINNLIHQGSIAHPLISCSGLSLPSEQPAVHTSVNLPISSSSFVSQSSRPPLLAEYSQDKFQTVRATIMQAPQMQELHLKQANESRKDSGKRIVQDDLLLSTAKRQKQCRAPSMRLEGMSSISQTPDSLGEQTKILASQIASNSSNSVVTVNSQGHADSLNPFTSSSSFMNTSLRQADIHCNSQPPISDQPQQGQTSNQHLQQHVPAQAVSHIHNNNPYLKQQQQTGQIRDLHHLYQQQHVSHTESSVHSQSHNVHQQRALQEVQMQKKRNLIQGTQPTQLSLQQKHHATDQARQKGSQPHPRHQQIQQQMQQHFGASQPDKSCENPATSRNHHASHPPSHLSQDVHQQPQDVGNRQQGSGISSEHISGHNQIQRLMTSRGMEQQMVSQPSIVSRPSNMTCAPHRQERNRVSSYSAEALIGKTPSNSEQRMGLSIQGPRVSDQLDMRSYLDTSRNKGLSIHNMQSHTSIDHNISSDVRLSDCQTFKGSGSNQQPPSTFEVQTSRNNEIGNPAATHRSMQPQTFRISQNIGPPMDRQKRLPYPPVQGIPTANVIPPRDNENSCHQSFMQSLLAPHLGEQIGGSQRSISDHQRNTQCGPSTTLEYSCPPAREGVHLRRDSEGQTRESCDLSMGTINSRNNSLNIPFSSSSSGEIQGRNTSPHVSVQKSNPMRMTDNQGTKNHLNAQVSNNMHGVVRPPLPHPSISRGSADQGQTSVRQPNSSVTQRSRHPLQDAGSSKIRRSGVQRHGNVFDPSLPHLPLAASGSMILGRQQSATEKRTSIVRFMSDNPQASNDNATPDQHALSQNFGFPFIPEGGINPAINTNPSFIPPVTQPGPTRTPALIPVDPQNTLPSFYPPYSPAHPSLSNDISIPYFSNQMFSNPSTEKPNTAGINNRFGSILSPPRPVGFAQPSFPLLPDIPPMHMANPSHLSNFNLTSLFPEIVTTLPPDGSAMSPLLSISNASASDSSKQSSNRPAHNISHILGHDCSSAV